MARLNDCSLIGVLCKKPTVIKDEASGAYRHASAYLEVVRGYRDAGDGKRLPVYDYIPIVTDEDSRCREIDSWNQFDIIYVDGMFVTQSVTKKAVCTHCHNINAKLDGVASYIYPIFCRKILSSGFKCTSDDEATVEKAETEGLARANQELLKWLPVSNRVLLEGNLANDPRRVRIKRKGGRDGKKLKDIVCCQCVVVSSRHKFIATDPLDKKADAPMLKVYGKECDSAYLRLMKGSMIHVDGYLQARNVNRHHSCDFCGQSFNWMDKALEVVPYSIEYLKDCRTEEEAEAEKEARKLQSQRDITAKLNAANGNTLDMQSAGWGMEGVGEYMDESDDQDLFL